MNSKQIDDLHISKKLVCPWQIVYLFDNFLRPLVHNPQKLFEPYVRAGMTVLDVGCGRGFTSLGLARLVGEDGLVIAADLQRQMLDMVKERASRAGLSNRVRIHCCQANHIGINEKVDFAVAFFMIHEVPETLTFLRELFTLLKPSGRLFITEPKIHVSQHDFERTVQKAQIVGFNVFERPSVRLGRTVVLAKS